MSLTDDELHALYTARPDAFVRVRNELARTLKKAGRRDDADDVAARRRPSAIAWSLNQVSHETPDLIDTWREAATELRNAMHRAVKGDADIVRGAQAAERRATDAIVTAARRHLDVLGAKDTDAVVARIAGTLRAAGLDDEIAERVRAGTLEAEVVASGFGFGDLSASTNDIRSAKGPSPRRSVQPGTARDAKADAKARAASEAAAEKARRAEASRLASEATRLATIADKAQRKADDLRTQSEELQHRLRVAERDARRARTEADRASAVAARAGARTAD
jgi:hypothetical protein